MAEAPDNYSDLELSEDEPDSLDGAFSRAANHLKSLVSTLDSQKLLELYSYYKQGTEGPCNVQRPRWYDAQGKLKWDAWHSLGAMPSHVAKETYVSLIKELDPSFGAESEEGRGKTESSWAAVSTLGGEDDHLEEADKTILDLAREGRADRVSALLEKQPELSAVCDDEGMCAVHWAADRGHTDVVRALMARCGRAPLERKDASGQTALHYAAACGHADTVRALLDAGVARDTQDDDGDTPLDLVTDPDIKSLLQS